MIIDHMSIFFEIPFPSLAHDEPDVFYDCLDQNYDESLQSIANNFYSYIGDRGHCEWHHDQESGQFSLEVMCHDKVS